MQLIPVKLLTQSNVLLESKTIVIVTIYMSRWNQAMNGVRLIKEREIGKMKCLACICWRLTSRITYKLSAYVGGTIVGLYW